MVPLVQVQMPFSNWCLVLSRRRGCLVCAAPIHLGRRLGLLPGFPLFGVSGSLRLLRRRVPLFSIGPFELTRLLLSRARGPVNPTPACHDFGGIVPGISPVLEAAYVAPAMHFEAFIAEYVKRSKSSGQVLPLGIEILKMRLDQRAHMPSGDCTSLEITLSLATEVVNNAAKDHSGLLSLKEPAITVSRSACPVGGVTGLAASAQTAVGCDTPVELNGYNSRPAPFLELGRARGKQGLGELPLGGVL